MTSGDGAIVSESLKLSGASRRLYLALINPENYSLTITALCDKAGVNPSTYYRRMADRDFVSAVKAEQKRQVEDKIGNVLQATYKYALEEKGHADRKMLLTWAGEYADKTETKLEGTVDIGDVSSRLERYLKADKDNGEDSITKAGD